jgi:hypothetical protein
MERYFALSAEIERAKADREYAAAVRAARATYPLLPAVVRRWKREYGRWDMHTSHAVHTAPTLMAVLEDGAGIGELRATLEQVPELREWLDAAEQAEGDLALVPRILRVVREEPGVPQNALKTRLDLAAAARASRLVAWLEKAGRLHRVRNGSTYQLYPVGHAFRTPAASDSASGGATAAGGAGSQEAARAHVRGGGVAPRPTVREATGAATAVTPRRASRRKPASARPLDFSGLPIVRLPMAPPTWAERDARDEAREQERDRGGDGADAAPRGRAARGAEPRFAADGAGWRVVREERLAPADRPDFAYRDAFHTGRHTHWLDPKGRRAGFETAAAVVRVTDRGGQVTAERGLAYDVYRADVNADGSGILFLSRDGVLHGYADDLTPFLEERLEELPEYQAQAARLGIAPRELKTHVRCVALAADRRRYVVTVVDEAWCLDVATGAVVWGVRMPTKAGWTRHVADRSSRAGTSAEVDAALRLMELELPDTTDDLTRRYRALTMRWHPDRNPGDAGATARFQQLRAAMELLTGADLSALAAPELERVTYAQVLATSQVRIDVPDGAAGTTTLGVNLDLTLMVGEKVAADWVYAANMGADGRTFLAGYSGKVVVLSPGGAPERVYDIGAVPRHIADAGERLYILTDTRLYVVMGDRLEALVDVYGASDVVVADRGFALLEPKALTWFAPDGARLGHVRTKDPLRRAYWARDGFVVETRQHRALIGGAPLWWADR